jgi:hypothetical protein
MTTQRASHHVVLTLCISDRRFVVVAAVAMAVGTSSPTVLAATPYVDLLQALVAVQRHGSLLLAVEVPRVDTLRACRICNTSLSISNAFLACVTNSYWPACLPPRGSSTSSLRDWHSQWTSVLHVSATQIEVCVCLSVCLSASLAFGACVEGEVFCCIAGTHVDV